MCSIENNEEIFILYIPPNMWGEYIYYKLKDNMIEKCSIDEVKKKPERILGFYSHFYTWSLEKKDAAIFLYNDIYVLFYNKEYTKLTQDNIEIKHFFNFSKITIKSKSSQPIIIKILTPPLRYLSNDGMFPEMVEPFISELKDIIYSYSERKEIYNTLSKKFHD
ncbi:hypothetical protein [Acinetobacter chinensis]|jgi:hypothetical protein|uniref:hypothetical protein n=1 Tax=Acinetobacter chinensis TaxID=2004650 RepID=UPI00293500D7|nr:hypothetical protein [Acinetobacter chinensis]WOE43181.1 hypothetical protein QSG87_08700 [Acinetobacter chinensis]